MMKFCANISTMFREYDFLTRFQKAKEFGFDFIELQSPYEDMPDVSSLPFRPKELCGLKCVLINSYTENGEFGYASIPGQEMKFCNSVSKSLVYKNVLDFKKLHILAGLKKPEFTFDQQFSQYVQSLNTVAEMLEDNGVIGLIEPICSEVKKDYFLDSFDLAVDVIKATTNVKLLLDIYHLHKITGDVVSSLEKYYPYAGHIQISQEPNRFEPFYPGGEIDYKFVFNFLKEKKYDGFIGLEYFPSGHTEASLDWMKRL